MPRGALWGCPSAAPAERAMLFLRRVRRGVAHLSIAQAEELSHKALSDQEPCAWEQPARPPWVQHHSPLCSGLQAQFCSGIVGQLLMGREMCNTIPLGLAATY